MWNENRYITNGRERFVQRQAPTTIFLGRTNSCKYLKSLNQKAVRPASIGHSESDRRTKMFHHFYS